MFCRKIELEGSLPSPRAAHSANIIGKKLYIFGGWTPRPQEVLKKRPASGANPNPTPIPIPEELEVQ